MKITVDPQAATLAETHGVDVQAVCNEALATAIEVAVASASNEAVNTARRAALEAVEATVSKLRPAVAVEAADTKTRA
jgi:hypothetical protein